MKPDNAPTVITAAECVVRGWAKLEVRDVTLKGDDAEFLGTDNSTWIMANTDKLKLRVEWLPTEAELASLRAQVARYQAALERMKRHIASAEQMERKIYEWSPEIDLYETLTRIADAALAETEEANE